MKISRFFSGLISIALCSSLIFSTYSCSSIFNGSSQKVSIRANEEGADIFVNGDNRGKTPAVIKLKRGKDHIIEIKKAGYDTYKITTDKSIAGMFWANLLCGGVVGMVIDLVTGNAYNIEPTVVSAQLTKSTSMLGNYNNGDYSYIFVKDKSGKIVDSFAIEWE
jgi:hypothetical protein